MVSWCQELQDLVKQVHRYTKVHLWRAVHPLARIEACLNSRPLSPMSEDPTDLLALTPGCFLVGGPLLSIVEHEVKGECKSILNRWRHLKSLHQQFRTRWKDEYLKELHKRNKWQVSTENLRVGDMAGTPIPIHPPKNSRSRAREHIKKCVSKRTFLRNYLYNVYYIIFEYI